MTCTWNSPTVSVRTRMQSGAFLTHRTRATHAKSKDVKAQVFNESAEWMCRTGERTVVRFKTASYRRCQQEVGAVLFITRLSI